MSQPKTVLLCRCVHADYVQPQNCERLLGELEQAGMNVQTVDDLCGLAARRDRRVLDLLAAAGECLSIVACYPRTIRWLLDWAGVPLPPDAAVFNMREQTVEQVVLQIVGSPGIGTDERDPLRVAAKQEERDPKSEVRNPQSEVPDDWIPWFPVIDYGRCKACRKCANFCLFAVYSVDGDGTVRVAQPGKCKTNCPACARLCPEAAIIFPKYPAAPINGDEITAENLADQQVGNDFGVAVDGNLLQTLRQRAAALADKPKCELSQARTADGQPACDNAECELNTSPDVPASVQQILDAMKGRRP